MTEIGKWQLRQVNHVNAIVDNYESTVEHFRDRLGFTFDRALPNWRGGGTDMCLMTLGGLMYEFFAPRVHSDSRHARRLAEHGDHYIGIEYGVPDVAEARAVCEEHGVRVMEDYGKFFFTAPDNSLGVSFEIWSGDFSEHAQPEGYWPEKHPMSLSGLAWLTIAVDSVEAALRRLQELSRVSILSGVERPQAAARGTQLQVGEIVWELLEPTGPGAVADYLERDGARIRSSVFRTIDLGRAERHLAAQGFDLIPGDAEESMAIRPDQNKNLLFEFIQ